MTMFEICSNEHPCFKKIDLKRRLSAPKTGLRAFELNILLEMPCEFGAVSHY